MMEYERNPYDEIVCLRAELAALRAELEVFRELEAENKTRADLNDSYLLDMVQLRARAERAEAELAAARGRYEWLADKVLAPDYGDNDTGCVGWNIKHCKGPTWIAGDSIDKAIDAARGAA